MRHKNNKDLRAIGWLRCCLVSSRCFVLGAVCRHASQGELLLQDAKAALYNPPHHTPPALAFGGLEVTHDTSIVSWTCAKLTQRSDGDLLCQNFPHYKLSQVSHGTCTVVARSRRCTLSETAIFQVLILCGDVSNVQCASPKFTSSCEGVAIIFEL